MNNVSPETKYSTFELHMNIEKIYKLSVSKFFAIYAITTVLVSLAMAGLYLLYLTRFGDISQWTEVLTRSIAVGFNTSNVEDTVPKTSFSNILFVLFVIHSLVLMLIGMILQGFVTARIIKPHTKLIVSKHATFNPRYGVDGVHCPHILFRLINTGASDLLAVKLQAYLIVRNEDDNGNISRLIYFPIKEIDPSDIPIINPMLVWKVAIPVQNLSNSYVKNYALEPHLDGGTTAGKRSIELLVSGIESASSSAFMQTFSISLERNKTNIEAEFYCGDFESLPLTLKKVSLDRINARERLDKEMCHSCTFNMNCVYFQH